jgi:hypothetical protein
MSENGPSIVPLKEPGDFSKRFSGNYTLAEINRAIHFYEKGANFVLSEQVDAPPANAHWFVYVADANSVNNTLVQLAGDTAPINKELIWSGKMWVSGVEDTAVKAYRAKS